MALLSVVSKPHPIWISWTLRRNAPIIFSPESTQLLTHSSSSCGLFRAQKTLQSNSASSQNLDPPHFLLSPPRKPLYLPTFPTLTPSFKKLFACTPHFPPLNPAATTTISSSKVIPFQREPWIPANHTHSIETQMSSPNP